MKTFKVAVTDWVFVEFTTSAGVSWISSSAAIGALLVMVVVVDPRLRAASSADEGCFFLLGTQPPPLPIEGESRLEQKMKSQARLRVLDPK